jgi:hypothetical protein
MLIARKFGLLTAVLAWAALGAAQVPPPQSAGDLDRELRIMARVIEESLDRSSLQGWHWVRGSASAFEPRVRHEYIPTVGAIFSVSVSFPLIDRSLDQQPADDPTPEKEPDLWEKHEKESSQDAHQEEFTFFDAPADVAAVISESVTEAMEGVNEAFTGVFGKKDITRTVTVRPYDEQKVNELRRVLIGAVAQYGYRIEHLPPDEKVILAVESAASGRSLAFYPAFGMKFNPDVPDVHVLTPSPEIHVTPEVRVERRADAEPPQPPESARPERAPRAPEAREEVARARDEMERVRERAERQMSDRRVEIKKQQRRGDEANLQFRHLRMLGDASAAADRYFVIIQKADLPAAASFDDIAPRVKEYRHQQ